VELAFPTYLVGHCIATQHSVKLSSSEKIWYLTLYSPYYLLIRLLIMWMLSGSIFLYKGSKLRLLRGKT
jgi:hypothetical protein